MHLQFKHLNNSAFFLFFYDYLTHVFLLGSPQTFLGLLSGRCWIGPLTRIHLEIRVFTPDSGLTSPFLIHRPSALLSFPFEDNCNLDLLKTLRDLLPCTLLYRSALTLRARTVQRKFGGKIFSEQLSWHVKVWFVLWNSNTIPSKVLGWPLKSNRL